MRIVCGALTSARAIQVTFAAMVAVLYFRGRRGVGLRVREEVSCFGIVLHPQHSRTLQKSSRLRVAGMFEPAILLVQVAALFLKLDALFLTLSVKFLESSGVFLDMAAWFSSSPLYFSLKFAALFLQLGAVCLALDAVLRKFHVILELLVPSRFHTSRC